MSIVRCASRGSLGRRVRFCDPTAGCYRGIRKRRFAVRIGYGHPARGVSRRTAGSCRSEAAQALRASRHRAGEWILGSCRRVSKTSLYEPHAFGWAPCKPRHPRGRKMAGVDVERAALVGTAIARCIRSAGSLPSKIANASGEYRNGKPSCRSSCAGAQSPEASPHPRSRAGWPDASAFDRASIDHRDFRRGKAPCMPAAMETNGKGRPPQEGRWHAQGTRIHPMDAIRSNRQ